MSKGKTNARNSNLKSASRFGNFVRTKSDKRNNSTTVIESDNSSESNNAGNVIYNSREIGRLGNDAIGNEDNDRSVSGGSGESGNSRTGGRGRIGSDGDTDNRATSNSNGNSDRSAEGKESAASDVFPVKKERKKRITIAQRAAQLAAEMDISVEEAEEQVRAEKATRKPRKVNSLDPEVEPGLTASVLILSSLLDGVSEIVAMAANKPYMQLEKDESRELSDAWLKVMDTWPKSVRKRFDQLVGKYYPYWNLGKVAVAITYPRWVIYQTEKGMMNVQQHNNQVQ